MVWHFKYLFTPLQIDWFFVFLCAHWKWPQVWSCAKWSMVTGEKSIVPALFKGRETGSLKCQILNVNRCPPSGFKCLVHKPLNSLNNVSCSVSIKCLFYFSHTLKKLFIDNLRVKIRVCVGAGNPWKCKVLETTWKCNCVA